MVHFVLKCGPFCPKTWSVLSLTWTLRFVLNKRAPFCPWSVLSMVLMSLIPSKTLSERKHKIHVLFHSIMTSISSLGNRPTYQVGHLNQGVTSLGNINKSLA